MEDVEEKRDDLEENDGVEGERNATPLMSTSASQEEVRSVQGQDLRASEEGPSQGEKGPEKAQGLSSSQIDSEELRISIRMY